MSDLDIVIALDPGPASTSARKVTEEVAKTEQAAKEAKAAYASFGEQLARVAKYQQLVAESARKEAEAERKAKVERLASVRAFDGMAEAIRREQQMLEKIHGPMRQHQQDVQVLNKLLAEGKINAEQHAAALAKSAAAAGQQQGPSKSFSQLRGKLLGGETGGAIVGGVLGGLVGGNVIGLLTQGLSSLIGSWGAHDRAVAESEQMLRRYFASSEATTRAVELQDLAARRLGVSLKEQTEAFIAVQAASERYYLTTVEQTRATEALGATAMRSGRDLKTVATFVEQLDQALSDGRVRGDEFRSLLKLFPQAVDAWAQSLGLTRDELQRLAEQGKLTTREVGAYYNTLKQGDPIQKEAIENFQQSNNWLERQVGSAMAAAAAYETLGDVMDRILVAQRRFTDDLEKRVSGNVKGGFEAIDLVVKRTGSSLIQFGRSLSEQSEKFDHLTRVIKQGFAITNPVTEARKNLKALEDAWKGTVDKSAGAMKLYRDQRKALLEAISGQPITDYYAEQLKAIEQPEKEWMARLNALDLLFKKGRVTLEQYTTQVEKLGSRPSPLGLSEEQVDSIYRREGHQVGEFSGFGGSLKGESASEALTRGLAKASPLIEAAKQLQEDYASAQKRITGNQEKYNRELVIANALLADGKITTEQHAKELKRIAEEQENLNGKMTKFGDLMRDQVLGSAREFSSLLVDAANGADVSWSGFFEGLATGLQKAIAQALVLKAITGDFGGVKGAGGYGGLLGLLGFATGGDALMTPTGLRRIPAAATGMDALVTGAGSTDSRLAMIRVTPQESIHVRTPEQRREMARGGGAPQVAIVNQPLDPRALLPMLRTTAGARTVLNTVGQHPDLVKALIG